MFVSKCVCLQNFTILGSDGKTFFWDRHHVNRACTYAEIKYLWGSIRILQTGRPWAEAVSAKHRAALCAHPADGLIMTRTDHPLTLQREEQIWHTVLMNWTHTHTHTNMVKIKIQILFSRSNTGDHPGVLYIKKMSIPNIVYYRYFNYNIIYFAIFQFSCVQHTHKGTSGFLCFECRDVCVMMSCSYCCNHFV